MTVIHNARGQSLPRRRWLIDGLRMFALLLGPVER
jgi:hypothetical protein